MPAVQSVMGQLLRLHVVAAALVGTTAHASGFRLESPDFRSGGASGGRVEFEGVDCSGGNRSPSLKWTNAPKDAKSFAVTVFDPDARTGSSRWRWMVINIPANVSELRADAGREGNANLPAGAEQVRLDYGFPAWGGVCPPPGGTAHRYRFTVFALKVAKLHIPADATAQAVRFAINANHIGAAAFTARYGRAE